jgi:hypothetical protein
LGALAALKRRATEAQAPHVMLGELHSDRNCQIQKSRLVPWLEKAQFPESGVTVDYLLAIFINNESA